MKNKKYFLLIVSLLLLFGWIIFASSNPKEEVNRIRYPDKADFIVSVYPEPNAQLSLSSYQANLRQMDELRQDDVVLLNSYGIVVKLDMEKIDGRMYPEKYPPTIFARVSLFLDGKEIDKTLKTGAENYVVNSIKDKDGNIVAYEHVGVQGIGWKIIPSLGFHEARFRIVAGSGKTFEYIWHFEVTP